LSFFYRITSNSALIPAAGFSHQIEKPRAHVSIHCTVSLGGLAPTSNSKISPKRKKPFGKRLINVYQTDNS